jgi:hypothetical protein
VRETKNGKMRRSLNMVTSIVRCTWKRRTRNLKSQLVKEN